MKITGLEPQVRRPERWNLSLDGAFAFALDEAVVVRECLSVGQELEEGAPVRGQQVRELATSLGERLLAAADLLDRLTAAGWSAAGWYGPTTNCSPSART